MVAMLVEGCLCAQEESAVRALFRAGGKGGETRWTGHLVRLKIQDNIRRFLLVFGELGAPVGVQHRGGLGYIVARDRER